MLLILKVERLMVVLRLLHACPLGKGHILLYTTTKMASGCPRWSIGVNSYQRECHVLFVFFNLVSIPLLVVTCTKEVLFLPVSTGLCLCC